MSLLLALTRTYCRQTQFVCMQYYFETPGASFFTLSLFSFSSYSILVFTILQAKQLSVWGRGAPFRFMVYTLLNVSLPNPFISLDYSPRANFPSFHHEKSALGQETTHPSSGPPGLSQLSIPPSLAIKRAFRLNICTTISESQTQNLCSTGSLISI